MARQASAASASLPCCARAIASAGEGVWARARRDISTRDRQRSNAINSIARLAPLFLLRIRDLVLPTPEPTSGRCLVGSTGWFSNHLTRPGQLLWQRRDRSQYGFPKYKK